MGFCQTQRKYSSFVAFLLWRCHPHGPAQGLYVCVCIVSAYLYVLALQSSEPARNINTGTLYIQAFVSQACRHGNCYFVDVGYNRFLVDLRSLNGHALLDALIFKSPPLLSMYSMYGT